MGFFSPNMDPDPQHHDLPAGAADLALHTITREEWLAELPVGKHLPRQPFKLVVEHFTFTEPCNTKDQCCKAVLDMQREHMANRLTDIKYNFLIGGDGNVYEGRGWHATPSKRLVKAPLLYRRRIDIAYIGDFTGKNIPEHMFERKMDIIDFGVKYGMIKATYNTIVATKEDDFPPDKEKKNSEGTKESVEETAAKSETSTDTKTDIK